MNHFYLKDMVKGWFVGNFSPTAFESSACEVSLKIYNAGEKEPLHHHKISTEITLVITGTIKMADKIWNAGDIIVLNPGEATDFEAITQSTNIVVKIPSSKNDKYLGKPD